MAKKRPLPADLRGQELIKLLARDQYERGLNQRVEELLLAHFQEVTRELVRDPAALSPGAARRTAAMFARVTRILREGYDKAESLTSDELLGYTGVEAQAAKAQLQALIAGGSGINVSMGNLTRAELKAIADMPIEGLKLGDWWEKQARDMTLATRQQIQLGMLGGEGADEIVRRIVPRGAQSSPAVWRRARNNANLLVRTSITTVQNTAAFEAYQAAGEDVTDSYRYVSAKDNRVTAICRALDGRVFKYKDPEAKRPPQHIGCRSTIIPEVKFEDLGLPRPPATGSPLSFRSYDAWLKDQSATQQNEIMGPARAELWRAGSLTLGQMVDTDNRTVNLKQLRERIAAVHS